MEDRETLYYIECMTPEQLSDLLDEYEGCEEESENLEIPEKF